MKRAQEGCQTKGGRVGSKALIEGATERLGLHWDVKGSSRREMAARERRGTATEAILVGGANNRRASKQQQEVQTFNLQILAGSKSMERVAPARMGHVACLERLQDKIFPRRPSWWPAVVVSVWAAAAQGPRVPSAPVQPTTRGTTAFALPSVSQSALHRSPPKQCPLVELVPTRSSPVPLLTSRSPLQPITAQWLAPPFLRGSQMTSPKHTNFFTKPSQGIPWLASCPFAARVKRLAIQDKLYRIPSSERTAPSTKHPRLRCPSTTTLLELTAARLPTGKSLGTKGDGECKSSHSPHPNSRHQKGSSRRVASF